MIDELERRGNRYFWNFREGNRYWLGYQHGHVAGTGLIGQESVYAFYFGSQDGMHRFYRTKDSDIFEYEVPGGQCALWMTDGDDEPGVPFVRASFTKRIVDVREREFLTGIIARFERGRNGNLFERDECA